MFSNSGEIINYFLQKDIHSQFLSYLYTHAKRYAYLLSEIRRIRKKIQSTSPVVTLDIGPSYFTELYSMEFPEDTLYTLGLDYPENRGGHFPPSIAYNKKAHIYYNLNDSQNCNLLPEDIPLIDIVILAEVIEHLHTAPEIVLQFLKQLMKSGSYLILQTPNAAELTKRTKLMFQGKNPYEMIRENADNPGHFREYTKRELIGIAKKTGFEICHVKLTNYFLYDSTKGAVQKIIRSLAPPGIRRYIFMVLKHP